MHAAKERNVWVTNAPTPTSMQSPICIRSHAVGCKTDSCSRQGDKAGKWPRILDLTFTANTRHRRTWHDRKEVAKRAQGFNMTV
ncbi:hypothetical protein PO124_11555 [Bacillus licheniformis]|nr:hypothetical protein [Bacillus licheniformis]